MTTEFTTPPGRLVQGSLYKGNTTDDKGQPLVFKSGQDAGQPRTEYYFAVAVPKTDEADWKRTSWGQIIASAAQAAWPSGQTQRPHFAWKVVDGDSTEQDQNGKAWNEKPGFAGNWVLKFGGNYQPTIFNRDGTAQITDVDAVQAGDWIQVFATVTGNNNTQSPGIYLNHRAVAFTGYGERIVYKVDGTQMGFGQAPMPEGVQAAPSGGFTGASAPTPPVAQAMPAAPAAPAPMAPPPAPEVLQAPTPPAAPTGPVMTAKAAGQPYEAFIAAGWTDEQLKANGYME